MDCMLLRVNELPFSTVIRSLTKVYRTEKGTHLYVQTSSFLQWGIRRSHFVQASEGVKELRDAVIGDDVGQFRSKRALCRDRDKKYLKRLEVW